MKTIAWVAIVIAASASPLCAAPSPAVNCKFAAPIETVTYAQMPSSIRSTIGPMAERNGAFQVTDVIVPGENNPGRRVIRAGHAGRNWFVWYEAGGVAYSWHAAVFQMAPGAAKPRVIADVLVPVSWKSGAWAAQTDVCALIDGALAAG